VIGLERVMTYHLRTRGPLPATEGSPRGPREYWEMTEGRLTGPGLEATIAMPGGDWFERSPDGFGRPDVRVQLQTEDGETILLSYTGLVEATDAFVAAAEADDATDWDDQYMRMVMTFETGAERHRWLNESLFIARGRILGKHEIEYEIYRVT
jgi:Protein of unknown function (DUF3237)